MTKHYRNQALFQLYTLIFGLDVIGNPVSVVRGVVIGAKDLFYEPIKVYRKLISSCFIKYIKECNTTSAALSVLILFFIIYLLYLYTYLFILFYFILFHFFSHFIYFFFFFFFFFCMKHLWWFNFSTANCVC